MGQYKNKPPLVIAQKAMLKAASKHVLGFKFDKDVPPPAPRAQGIDWFVGVDLLDQTAVAAGTGPAASAISG